MWASTIPNCVWASMTQHHDLLGWFREYMNRAYGSSIGLTFEDPKQLSNKKEITPVFVQFLPLPYKTTGKRKFNNFFYSLVFFPTFGNSSHFSRIKENKGLIKAVAILFMYKNDLPLNSIRMKPNSELLPQLGS